VSHRSADFPPTRSLKREQYRNQMISRTGAIGRERSMSCLTISVVSSVLLSVDFVLKRLHELLELGTMVHVLQREERS
jgi:hypothetical protein